MQSRMEELFQFLHTSGDDTLNTEDELENMLAYELAFATELCDICVVDDEWVIPDNPGCVSGKTLASKEAHLI